jgi:hypothetical protein
LLSTAETRLTRQTVARNRRDYGMGPLRIWAVTEMDRPHFV